jgi:hypothetical protein
MSLSLSGRTAIIFSSKIAGQVLPAAQQCVFAMDSRNLAKTAISRRSP